METPIDQRVSSAESSPSGFLSPSGVLSLKQVLSGNPSGFAQWASNPMTVKVRGALQDLVLHPPTGFDANDRMVQYGLTQGLLIALQVMTDPSMVWPGVFGKGTNENVARVMPPMDFGTSIDDAISKGVEF